MAKQEWDDAKVRQLTKELADWVGDKLDGAEFEQIAAALENTLEDVRVAAAEHNDPPEINTQPLLRLH